MPETAYPKLKYQGVPVEPGTRHTDNPGYIYQRVEDPAQESALDGEWFDSPGEAVKAFRAKNPQRAPGAQQAQPTATPAGDGGDGGNPHQAPVNTKKSGAADAVEKIDLDKPRRTEEFPTESEKRRR